MFPFSFTRVTAFKNSIQMAPDRSWLAANKKTAIFTPLSGINRQCGNILDSGRKTAQQIICKQCQCELKYSVNTMNLAGYLNKKRGLDIYASFSITVSDACTPALTSYFLLEKSYEYHRCHFIFYLQRQEMLL